MSPTKLRAAATLLVLSLLGTTAFADEDAKTVFEHGTALFALHKFAEAALVFEKAFELRPDAAILYNAAQAHRLAGNSARALVLYDSLLRLYGARITNRAEINDHIRELRHAVDAAERATQAPPQTTIHEPPPAPAKPKPVVVAPAPPPPVVARPVVVAPPVVAPAPTMTVAPAPIVLATPPEPAPRKRPRWLWGVVGGAAAVVVIVAVGVGVGVGAQPADPKASFGGIQVH